MDAQTIAVATNNTQSTTTYLSNIEHLIRTQFSSADLPPQPFAREDWKTLTDQGIMRAMIPTAFGGRDSHEELCQLIESVARYNLPLSMYTMIITTLFVRNVAKYGSETLKEEVLPAFSSEALIGGFALTEPGCGSNLAKMTTVYETTAAGYELTGEKHWQAFSATADWWLVAAKNKHNEREFSFFILKREEGFTNVEVYHALGLKAIDYGRNVINAIIPAHRKLNVTAGRLEGAVDMLCASRLSMSAMASGFTARIHEEAAQRVQNRKIGNGILANLGYVQYKLMQLAANHTISRALLVFVTRQTDFRNDLTAHFFEAQAVKTLSTDKMLESALNYQQLCGGEGYRHNSPGNTAAYALLDARVYTVFDGTNDLLSQQLAEYCMQHAVNGDVVAFLSQFDKTSKGMQHLNFDVAVLNNNEDHARKVLNGQIIARVFGLNCLEEAMWLEGPSRLAYADVKKAAAMLVADIKKVIAEIEVLQLTDAVV